MYTAIAQLLRTSSHSPLRLRVPGIGGLCLLACLASPPAGAVPIVLYTFDDGGAFYNGPDSVAAHLTATPWSDQDGTLGDYAGNPGRAVAAAGWADGNAFRFALTVAPGYALGLSGFSFDQRASGTGAKNWTLKLGGTLLGSGATSTGFTQRAGTVGLTGLTDQLLFELAGGGGDSTAGTWRIDNFSLDGTLQAQAVPEPSVPALLASVLAAWTLIAALRFPRRRTAQSG